MVDWLRYDLNDKKYYLEKFRTRPLEGAKSIAVQQNNGTCILAVGHLNGIDLFSCDGDPKESLDKVQNGQDDITVVRFVDIDKDGDKDLLFSHDTGNEEGIGFHKWDADTSGWIQQDSFVTQKSDQMQALDVGDIDRNGFDDVIVGTIYMDTIVIVWYQNMGGKFVLGEGEPILINTFAEEEGYYRYQVNLIDLDDDEDLDIVLIGYDEMHPSRPQPIMWLRSNGGEGGNYFLHEDLKVNFEGKRIPSTLVPSSIGIKKSIIADVDEDGDLDIISASHNTLVWFADKCAAEEYFDATNTSCRRCSAGHYCEGKGVQTKCPLGKWTYDKTEKKEEKSGGREARDCTLCKLGFKCPSDGSYRMKPEKCSRGTYQDEEGKISCKACLPGYFSDILGSSDCLVCPGGKYGNSTLLARCLECEAGKFHNQTGKTREDSCKLCSKGYYCQTGSTEEISCDAGKYGAKLDLKSADECTE